MGNYIKKQYKNYVNNVSSSVMAISYELSVYMWKYINKQKPKYILDLGSGFSSFLFRYYKKEYNNEAVIFSVDTSKEWLLKTEEFLKENDLSIKNLYTFDDFKKIPQRQFDYILYDLGSMSTRHENLEYILQYKKDNTPCIIDDVHKLQYKNFVLETVKRLNLKYKFLTDETYDSYGRFSMEVK